MSEERTPGSGKNKKPITLKQLRKKLNLTQKALAEKMGTTPTTISKYETGQWVMNQMFIDEIFEVYGEIVRPLLHATKKKPKKIWKTES